MTRSPVVKADPDTVQRRAAGDQLTAAHIPVLASYDALARTAHRESDCDGIAAWLPGDRGLTLPAPAPGS